MKLMKVFAIVLVLMAVFVSGCGKKHEAPRAHTISTPIDENKIKAKNEEIEHVKLIFNVDQKKAEEIDEFLSETMKFTGHEISGIYPEGDPTKDKDGHMYDKFEVRYAGDRSQCAFYMTMRKDEDDISSIYAYEKTLYAYEVQGKSDKDKHREDLQKKRIMYKKEGANKNVFVTMDAYRVDTKKAEDLILKLVRPYIDVLDNKKLGENDLTKEDGEEINAYRTPDFARYSVRLRDHRKFTRTEYPKIKKMFSGYASTLDVELVLDEPSGEVKKLKINGDIVKGQ